MHQDAGFPYLICFESECHRNPGMEIATPKLLQLPDITICSKQKLAAITGVKQR